MKIILTEDIDRLGRAGDIVAVKEGYARNYLLPKGKAKPATDANMKAVAALKTKTAAEENRIKEEAKSRAEKLAALSITISAAAGEEEKLYGSVTNETISSALKSEGFDIDKKDIILDSPIKKLGVYQVAVKVHPEVKADLRIWVVKE